MHSTPWCKQFACMLLLWLISVSGQAQTTLFPGDLAVIGVNANRSECEGANADWISFVTFVDIEPNTLIDLTDNGYARRQDDLWGNSEGFVSVRRTGSTIPAGTVITFRMPPIGESYQALAPDADWEFTQLSVNGINFNADGDQLFLLQGGEWNDGTAAPGSFEHDAAYDGGRVLFAVNSKPDWNALADSGQDSGLPPEVDACHSMASASSTATFFAYDLPSPAPASPLDWIESISEPTNWIIHPDCNSFPSFPILLPLEPNGITLNCTVCSGCGPLQETFQFSLPAAGGPFEVTISDGAAETVIPGLSDGSTFAMEVAKTVSFEIVSVVTAAGCTASSGLGGPVTVTVGLPPDTPENARLEGCANRSGEAGFDLTSLNPRIDLNGTGSVSWYEDADTTSRIMNAGNYVSEPGLVYAVVLAAGCRSEPVPVTLETVEGPTAGLSIVSLPSCNGSADGRVRADPTGGTPPYIFDWNINRLDGLSSAEGLPAGEYFLTVTDQAGCRDSAGLTLREPEVLLLSCNPQRPVSGSGAADGQGLVNIRGGIPPYEVSWTGPGNGNTTADAAGDLVIDGLSAGNYQVEVQDANGCSQACAFAINDPSCDLTLSVDTQNESCAGTMDGAIDLNIQGGTDPFDIDWDSDELDGQNALSGLGAGTYEVVVTDAAGCVAPATVTLTADYPALMAFISPGGTICADECAGFSMVLEGTPPFELTYEIQANGVPQTRTATLNSFNSFLDICPSDYNPETSAIQVTFLELSDAHCTIALNQIEFIPLLEAPTTILNTTLCTGSSLEVNGTVYNESNPSGREVITGGAINGCDSTVQIDLRFSESIEYRLDSTLCAGESLTVNGVQYDASNPSGREVIEGGSMTGCDSIVLINLQFAPAVTAGLEGGDTLCAGESATLTLRLSGADRATIQYTDGINEPVRLEDATDGQPINVSPTQTTTYVIEFVQAGGVVCPARIDGSATIVVSDLQVNADIVSEFDGYGVSCFGSRDGILEATTSGGSAPVDLQWNTGAIENRLENLSAGEYTVEVTDDAGCRATDTVRLTQPDEIVFQSRLEPTSCPGTQDGAIVIEALDGVGSAFTYSINGQPPAPLGDLPFTIPDLGPGDYELRIQDANDCAADSAFSIQLLSPLTLELGPDTTLQLGDSLRFAPLLNFTADSLVWIPERGLSDPNSLTPTARPAENTSYQLTVFDAKGCSVSAERQIQVNAQPAVYAPNAFSPDEDGVNDRFILFARSGLVQSITLRIFDRWGMLVFERNDLSPNAEEDGWDGTVRGQPAHQGVYVFMAELSYEGGQTEVIQGDVLLIR